MTHYTEWLTSLPPEELEEYIEAFSKTLVGKLHYLQEEAQACVSAHDAEQIYFWGINNLLQEFGHD